ncbi:hypothetical protein ACFSJ3_11285 [Corallincola platygyrae]|uniref:Uncharacterized protein n=1 Tax=Corallincola platygyrae TaxID=1193278 RepID=A0ABW4XMU0_9GAMM
MINFLSHQDKNSIQQRLTLGRCLLVLLLFWQGLEVVHAADHPIHLDEPEANCVIHFQQSQPCVLFDMPSVALPISQFSDYKDIALATAKQSAFNTPIRDPPVRIF